MKKEIVPIKLCFFLAGAIEPITDCNCKCHTDDLHPESIAGRIPVYQEVAGKSNKDKTEHAAYPHAGLSPWDFVLYLLLCSL